MKTHFFQKAALCKQHSCTVHGVDRSYDKLDPNMTWLSITIHWSLLLTPLLYAYLQPILRMIDFKGSWNIKSSLQSSRGYLLTKAWNYNSIACCLILHQSSLDLRLLSVYIFI